MSSTLDSIIAKLKANPTQLKEIGTLLEQLLSKKHPEQQKQRVAKQLIAILDKIQAKIDEKKQASTHKYIQNIRVQLMEVLVHCLKESEFGYGWYQVMADLVKSNQAKQQICVILRDCVCGEHNLSIIQLKNAELIVEILKQIDSQYANKNFQLILNFLLQIDHINSLQFADEAKSEQPKLKQLYQKILITCLQYLEKLSIQEQATIYNKLGDKVFSKLASPLALSEFLLTKIMNEEENPVIQIQVLSCLFILVGKYGLELEKFYQNLQKIIAKKRSSQSSLFRLKNSKRFLKLVEAAMRSSKVPFKTILSLSRLLLQMIPNQKSQYTFWVVSFFVNLVKKHRQLQVNLGQFPEIEALKYHYSPRVRALVRQIQKNLNKAEYLDIEDFSKISCKKLCDQKLQEISAKMQECEQIMQFKLPNVFDKL